MNLNRCGRLAGVALAGALALTACGSDNNSDTDSAGSSSSTGAGGIDCASGQIEASGSSAQANAMSEWIKNYQTQCSGATINYGSVGSGQGVKDFTSGQTAFGGSDSALKPEEHTAGDARCKTGKALDLPMVTGPIAVTYQLDGVDKLVLTPQVIAKIFSGKVTTWNDPAIAAVNSGASLPSTKIATIHRSDSSGTTDNFTKYLAKSAGSDWTYDHDKLWKAPGGQGAKGNEGIAAAMQSTPGAISYNEYSFALDSKLSYAQIDNGGGAVELTSDAVGKAVEAAQVTGTGNDLTLELDYTTKSAGAYPILLVTYELVCEKGLPDEAAKLVKSFLTYTSSDAGQSKLTEIGYAPLPASVLSKVQATVGKLS